MEEASDTSATNKDRAYQYDAIGNREKTVNGLLGDLAPLTANYDANALNQYTLANGVTLPTPAYDADGNYRNGPLPVATGNATLVWDAENRLVQVTRADNAVITYTYDYLSRRISKKVGSATAERFIYDGWNLIAKYAGTTLVESYVWGMDLSGSTQGAGGVGGLLAVVDEAATGDPAYFPTYDGNGNVSEYLQVITADDPETENVNERVVSIVAHYEYDPFGNTTVVPTGTKASDFAHRFSTKPLDSETGLYYYGYRYYDPVTSRWPSRDPIGEEGGVNLYGFVRNDGVDYIDYLGLKDGPIFGSPTLKNEGAKCNADSAKLKSLKFSGKLLHAETNSDQNQATLTLDYQIDGTTGDVNWTMYTCFRPGGAYGPIPGSERSKSVTFTNATPQLIGLTFAFLSCECRDGDPEDKIWKRIEKRTPATLYGDGNRTRTKFKWRGFDKTQDDLYPRK